MTNTHPETGIAYGVISGNSLDPNLLNDLMYGSTATNVSYENARKEAEQTAAWKWDNYVELATANVRNEGRPNSEDEYDEALDVELEKVSGYNDRDDFIEAEMDTFANVWEDYESTYTGKLDDVEYQLGWLGGAIIVTVLMSPYKTLARRCSPCIPGAGDLDNVVYGEDHDYVECYDVPPGWRYEEAQRINEQIVKEQT